MIEELSKWRFGKPTKVGWWDTRLGFFARGRRFWDGARWSYYVKPDGSVTDAAAFAAFLSKSQFDQKDIEWRGLIERRSDEEMLAKFRKRITKVLKGKA